MTGPRGAPVTRFHPTGHDRSVRAGRSLLAVVFFSALAGALTPTAGPHREQP
jgi:hypothetical protein